MHPILKRVKRSPRLKSKNQSLGVCGLGFGRQMLRQTGASLLAAALCAAGATLPAVAQPSPSGSGEPISIVYGYITHHYLTSWEDRNLPAGILRGLPPLVGAQLEDETEKRIVSSLPDDDAALAETGAPQLADDAAILYQLDLGERGMQMIVSAKTGLKPGHCIALEQRGLTSNLRRVSEAFCDPVSGQVTESVDTIRALQADYCMQAMARLQTGAADTESINSMAEIQMLCDGG